MPVALPFRVALIEAAPGGRQRVTFHSVDDDGRHGCFATVVPANLPIKAGQWVTFTLTPAVAEDVA